MTLAIADADPPGDISTTVVAPINASVTGEMSGADQDWFLLELEVGQTYGFWADASGYDPYAAGGNPLSFNIRDANGSHVQSGATASFGDGSHYYEFTVETAGPYYVAMSTYLGHAVEYELFAVDVATFRPNYDDVPARQNTFAVVDVGGAVHEDIEVVGDSDMFRLWLEAGKTYTITLVGDGPSPIAQPALRLIELEGYYIAAAGGSGPGSAAELHFTPEQTGSYFVSAAAMGSETGGYSISLEETTDQDPRDTIDSGQAVSDTAIQVYFARGGEEWDEFSADRNWQAGEMDAFMEACATYSAVCNVTFERVTNPDEATMVVLLDGGIGTDLVGLMTLPPATPAIGVFNPDPEYWNAGSLKPGGYAFTTLVHEIGHALGLDHPHDDGGGSEVMWGVTSEFDSLGDALLNQGVFTTMSYNDGWYSSNGYLYPDVNWGRQTGPMALDIAVLQEKYGSVARHAGNDVYVLPSANQAGLGYSAIWDTGGVDTIVYEGPNAAHIDLRPASLLNQIGGGGYVSYANTIDGGFTVAAGVQIENATGGSGQDTLYGNDLANVLQGGANNDQLNGLGGADRLDGGAGWDSMRGGAGDDVYVIDNKLDTVVEEAGNGVDRVESLVNVVLWDMVENLTLVGNATTGHGNALANHVVGNARNNVLTGAAGSDILEGGLGDDTVRGGLGADIVNGGVGVDTADFSDQSLAVAVVLSPSGGGTAMVGGVTDDTLIGIENLLGGLGADSLTGNAAANRLIGGKGADWLSGKGGADILDGGVGVDTASYSEKTLAVVVTLAGATQVGVSVGGVAEDLISGIENLEGGAAGDTLTGDAFDNRFLGNRGDDVLSGAAGADWLDGGRGADTLVGGLGNDTFIVDSGADVVVELAGQGVDTVLSSAGYVLGAEVENLTLNGAAVTGAGNALANVITGTELANTLLGHGGNDTLNGLGGADRLDGGEGADRLVGGLGDDTYVIDNAGDVVVELLGQGNDRVDAAVSFTVGRLSVETIYLTGANAIDVTGGALGETITGNAAANRITGGGGADTLRGGGGPDTFAYGALSDSATGASDIILDYRAMDRLDLSAIDANAGREGEGAFTRIGNDAAFSDRGQLRLSFDGTNTLVELNLDGDQAAEMTIVLAGNWSGATTEDNWIL